MIHYTCDLDGCGKKQSHPLPIELRGYHPRNMSSGILLPEQLRTLQFCSHACFVKWIQWALDHESNVSRRKEEQ